MIEEQRTNRCKANTAGTDDGYDSNNSEESFDVKPPDGSNNSVRKIKKNGTSVKAQGDWTTGTRWHTVFFKPGDWGKIGFRLVKGGYQYFWFDVDSSPPKVWRSVGSGMEESPPPESYILEEYAVVGGDLGMVTDRLAITHIICGIMAWMVNLKIAVGGLVQRQQVLTLMSGVRN